MPRLHAEFAVATTVLFGGAYPFCPKIAQPPWSNEMIFLLPLQLKRTKHIDLTDLGVDLRVVVAAPQE